MAGWQDAPIVEPATQDGGWQSAPVIGNDRFKLSPDALKSFQGKPNVSVVMMKPDQYLALSPDFKSDPWTDRKGKSLKASLDKGDEVYAPPELEVVNTDKGSEVIDQDGRHRALAAKEAGIDLIPVAITKLGKGQISELQGMPSSDGSVQRVKYDFKPAEGFETQPGDKVRQMTKAERVGTGALDVAAATTQTIAHALPGDWSSRVDKKVQEREKDIAASSPQGTDWYRLGGNVAASLPLAALGGGPAVTGLAAGALTQPVTEGPFWAQKGEQGAAGLIGGKTAEVGGNMLARAVKPTFNAAVQKLLDEGVTLTPGQMSGKIGKGVEDLTKALPITGFGIRSGERKSIESFNRAAWNRVLAPLGEKMPDNVKMGAEAASHVSDRIDVAYDQVWPHVRANADATFLREMTAITQEVNNELPTEQARIFGNYVRSQLLEKDLSSGAALKAVDSKLGKVARDYKGTQDPDKRLLGEKLDDLKMAFRATIERQNPQYAAQMDRLNSAYANYVRVSRAASAMGAHGDIFTPAQLDNAVRMSDKSVAHRAFGKGKALLQDLSQAGMAVLPPTIPSSGTAERLAWTGLMEAAGSGGAAIPLGLVGSLPYTNPGLATLRAWATGLPATRNYLAKGVRNLGQVAAPGAGMLAATQGPTQ
jgi:hypothetical protein